MPRRVRLSGTAQADRSGCCARSNRVPKAPVPVRRFALALFVLPRGP